MVRPLAKGGIAVAVLAAGSSRRFGDADKLAARFRGKRLGEHVCAALAKGPFAHRWVIASRADHPCHAAWGRSGFITALNARSSEGMGTSVALAANLARQARCKALLISLADTPLVPAEHFATLAAKVAKLGDGGIIVSRSHDTLMPPAAFGAAHFERLAQLTGDKGARAILQEGKALACPPEWLIDIDTPEALARFENP
ncbi:MAG: nucleotidyltransferase family protein [Pseudomonadota bacterium]